MPDTPERRSARETLLAGLESTTLQTGLWLHREDGWLLEERVRRGPLADALDSLLCAVQAAWAYLKRDDDYGVPPECDPDEGWILDPALLAE